MVRKRVNAFHPIHARRVYACPSDRSSNVMKQALGGGGGGGGCVETVDMREFSDFAVYQAVPLNLGPSLIY